jgi:two-component system cell cycle response regulator
VNGTRDAEVSPVSDRLLVLQFVRVLIVVALLAVPVIAGTSATAVVEIALVYLVFVAVVELVRRVAPEYGSAVVSWTVLVDGAAVAVAVAVSGGYRSPLLFLVFLVVMAVTLIASYRTGLKLALWCALLLLVAHAAADAGVIDEAGFVDDRVAIVSAATFLLFALCTALFSAVNERSLRHSRAQLERLVELGSELERAMRQDDVMATLVHHSCSRLGFARAVVMIHAGQEWDGVRDDGAVEIRLQVPDHDSPLVRETWSTGAPMLVRVVDDDLLDLVLPGARNVVVAPVAVDGHDLGVVVAEWGGGADARIPTSTVQALAQAATHTALALRNAQLLGEIERLATRDSLTGLPNRRLFDESLHREIARSQRLGTPLSLLVLDIDHFKQVNDTYGHQTGDSVLCEVASALVANTKNFDVPARYGGDEFVVLLPGCSRHDAMSVAERVRNGIAEQVGEAPVTISAGVASAPDNANDAERLMAAADAALYDAKRTGRDRVEASTRGRDGTASASSASLDWSAPLARGA